MRLLGVRSPAPRGTALCALGDTCSLAFRGAGLRVLRRTRPRALRKVRFLFIGAHANFVGLVGGQILGGNGRNLTIFRNLNGLTAHGQRHVDRGGVLVKVIAKAGVLPLAAVFLIDRHAVAVGIRHLFPCSPHHLVADKFQRDIRRCVRLIVVRISDRIVKLLAVDGHKSGHIFALSVLIGDRGGLFRHQERSDVVLAAGRVRTTVGNIDENFAGVHFDLLVDQVVRAALFLGKIGAQGIRCILFGVLDFAGHLIVAQSQIQLFKRCNGNSLRFVLYKRKGTCVDLISPAFPQPQQHHAVFVSVYILDKVGACVDVRGGIDLADLLCFRAFLFHPVDIGNLRTVFRNSESFLNLLLSDVLVKRQQDIRRFVCTGVYRDRLSVSTAVGLRIRRIRGQHDSKLLPVLQRDGLHHRRHAVVLPFPLGQLFDQFALKIPSRALFEVGFDDIRKNDPRAHIIEPVYG